MKTAALRPDLRIDYPNHPGFQNLADRPSADVPELDEHFATLDRRFDEFKSIPGSLSPWEVETFVRESISPLLSRMKSIVRRSMEEGDLFRESTCEALGRIKESFHKELLFRNSQKSYRHRQLPSHVERIRDELDREGLSMHRIPKERIEEIWKSLAGPRAELERRRASRPKGMASCAKSLPLIGPAFEIFKSELETLGVIEAIEAYSRHKMDLDYCALHLSHEHEDWYRDCYSDVGLPTQRTTYMHFNQDFSLVKAMIYLRDFDEKTLGPLAPFALVKREDTNHWSYAKRVFFKELDAANDRVVQADPDSATSYYRKSFKFLKFRREFLKIPLQLQGSSHFGDDLTDSSPLSDYLLSREKKLDPASANCAVFTGGHNVHRGGMVPKGERWAFQVGFRMRDTSLKGALRRARLKAGLSYSSLKNRLGLAHSR